VLEDGRLGRLGCIAGGEPYIVPVNYVIENGAIYLHSLPGRKIDALRADPRACFQVDDIRDDYHWRSVLAFGKFEEVSDPVERKRMLRVFFARFPHLTPVEAVVKNNRTAEVIVSRIRIDKVTGVGEGLLRSAGF
jgi:nitroimidazol reductase NimA-like FMN-containing flavoprotein (pyridoxamine 5'-phosphate oxidase superfamily)